MKKFLLSSVCFISVQLLAVPLAFAEEELNKAGVPEGTNPQITEPISYEGYGMEKTLKDLEKADVLSMEKTLKDLEKADVLSMEKCASKLSPYEADIDELRTAIQEAEVSGPETSSFSPFCGLSADDLRRVLAVKILDTVELSDESVGKISELFMGDISDANSFTPNKHIRAIKEKYRIHQFTPHERLQAIEEEYGLSFTPRHEFRQAIEKVQFTPKCFQLQIAPYTVSVAELEEAIRKAELRGSDPNRSSVFCGLSVDELRRILVVNTLNTFELSEEALRQLAEMLADPKAIHP